MLVKVQAHSVISYILYSELLCTSGGGMFKAQMCERFAYFFFTVWKNAKSSRILLQKLIAN